MATNTSLRTEVGELERPCPACTRKSEKRIKTEEFKLASSSPRRQELKILGRRSQEKSAAHLGPLLDVEEDCGEGGAIAGTDVRHLARLCRGCFPHRQHSDGRRRGRAWVACQGSLSQRRKSGIISAPFAFSHWLFRQPSFPDREIWRIRLACPTGGWLMIER